MKKYVLCQAETYAYEDEIKNGVCIENEQPCDIVAEFETKEQAIKELKKYSSNVFLNYKNGKKVCVIEYFVEEETYDECGNFETSKIIAYADGLQK